jgi:hypothetical protein
MAPVSKPPSIPPPGWEEQRSSFEGPLVDRLFRPPLPSIPPQSFEGQNLLVVFNRNARQGRFAGEAEGLRRILGGMGFRVHFLETVPDPVERSERIREAATRILNESPNAALQVFPVGGDGITDEAMREAVQTITGPLNEVPPDSDVNEILKMRLGPGLVARVGTASDIGTQLGAPPGWGHSLRSLGRRLIGLGPPPHFTGLPRFISNSQTLPMGIPVVHSYVAPNRTAFHSAGFGTSGYLFSRAEANRRADPTNFWNQGLLNYFRVLPRAIREYGLMGVGVEIEHRGRVDSFRVGEVLGSSNRILAFAGGIPGRWGEFKLLAIPNGPAGVAVMMEAVARGLGTKLGYNLVGADADFWTLSRERQITLRPGERARLRFFDPSTRAPVEVPWQLNGDAVAHPTSEAEIYVPPVTIPVRADQGAEALRLYREDELRRGLSVSNGDGASFSVALNLDRPSFLTTSRGGGGATSAFYPASDLRAVVTGYDLEPSRLPLLIARAHGVQTRDELASLGFRPLSMEKVEHWLRSEQGRARLDADWGLVGDTFRNRLETEGPGLALGLVTFAAADRLATRVGIDPERDRLLHFSAVAYTSHAVNLAGNASASVLINRARGIPYDWAAVEGRGAQGLMAQRMVYETEPGLLRAMGKATLRSWGLRGGVEFLTVRGAAQAAAVPFRVAYGMGPGLAASRLTDTLLSRVVPEQTEFRHAASGLAFFAPSLYHLAAGNRGLAILESVALRRMGALFAAGFIADLLFTGVQSLSYGNRAAEERWINHRVSALRDLREDRGLVSFHGLLDLICPEIAAYNETFDDWSLQRNEDYRRVSESERTPLLIDPHRTP